MLRPALILLLYVLIDSSFPDLFIDHKQYLDCLVNQYLAFVMID